MALRRQANAMGFCPLIPKTATVPPKPEMADAVKRARCTRFNGGDTKSLLIDTDSVCWHVPACVLIVLVALILTQACILTTTKYVR